MPAKVLGIEYDPNRSSRIALIQYEDGVKAYILAPEGLKAGDRFRAAKEGLEPRVGNCMPLKAIPLGMSVHNLEMQPGHGGQLCRSAGCERHADGPRRQVGADHAAVRRGAPRISRSAGRRSA